MEYKTCIKCAESKELKSFATKRNTCKSCRYAASKDYQKAWRVANRDKGRAYSKAYFDSNKNNPNSAAKLYVGGPICPN